MQAVCDRMQMDHSMAMPCNHPMPSCMLTSPAWPSHDDDDDDDGIDGAGVHAEFLHVKPGKGAAFVRSKLKSYLTGNTVERTFRAGESVDVADVSKKDTQFTYIDGDEVSVG